MATLTARGTARVRFNDIEVDVDVEELVAEAISDALPSNLDLDDVDVDEVENSGW